MRCVVHHAALSFLVHMTPPRDLDAGGIDGFGSLPDLGGVWRGGLALGGTGEFYMLLAAQSMALGTVMVRWVRAALAPTPRAGCVHVLRLAAWARGALS